MLRKSAKMAHKDMARLHQNNAAIGAPCSNKLARGSVKAKTMKSLGLIGCRNKAMLINSAEADIAYMAMEGIPFPVVAEVWVEARIVISLSRPASCRNPASLGYDDDRIMTASY